MKRAYIAALTATALLCAAIALPPNAPRAQQQKYPPAALAIDLPEIVAEVKAAHDRYEQALVLNNDPVLGESFRNDPRTVRYGNAENLYGYAEIEAYRAASSGPGPRRLAKTVITTYGRDFAVASTLSYRANASGKVGRQMQT